MGKVVCFDFEMKQLIDHEYGAISHHIVGLPCWAIMATGRSGSDYFHSLFESHPEVLTFNGHFDFYCSFIDVSKVFASCEPEIDDAIDEFIGLCLMKLVSKYDLQEAKNTLGPNHDESFRIDTKLFKLHASKLLAIIGLSPYNLLLATHAAYSLCLGRNLLSTRVILFHPHLEREVRRLAEDAVDLRMIFTVRDPRASILSQVENFRSYYPDTHDGQGHLYESRRMNLLGPLIIEDLKLPSLIVRLEDLPKREILERICNHLGISWSESILLPTWSNLIWNGDRLSKRRIDNEWSENRTYNGWKIKLTRRDQLLIRTCLNSRLTQFGYQKEPLSKTWLFCGTFLSILPMSLELRYITPKYLISRLRLKRVGVIMVLEVPFYFLKRIWLTSSFIKRVNQYRETEQSWVIIQ